MSSRFRFVIGLIGTVVLLVVGAAIPSSAADNIGCSFQAPATIGVADLVTVPDLELSPPPPLPEPVPLINFTLDGFTAGCSQIFLCRSICHVDMIYGFSGAGLVAGEVVIEGYARSTCGPSLSTPLSDACGGQFGVTLPSGGYLLTCRAYGVVAALVSGFCKDISR